MNLILFKRSELQSSSEDEEEGDVRRLEERVKKEEEDNYVDKLQKVKRPMQNKGQDSTTSAESSFILNFNSTDKRTKHILNHLKKESGQHVYVGCLGGNKGQAIVDIVIPSSKSNDVSVAEDVDKIDNNEEKEKTLTSENGAKKRKNKKQKNSSGFQKEERSVRLTLLFHPFAAIHGQQQQPLYNIALVVAAPFPKVMKSLFTNIPSMGISRIVVIRSHLSHEDHCKTSILQNPNEYTNLVEEGLSQGCHTYFPKIDIDIDSIITAESLKQLLLPKDGEGHVDNIQNIDTENTTSPDAVKLFLDCGNETYDPPPILRVLIDKLKNNSSSIQTKANVIIAIGPERGWTDHEMTLFENVGFHSAMLGKSILKVETATIASLGIVCSVLDSQ